MQAPLSFQIQGWYWNALSGIRWRKCAEIRSDLLQRQTSSDVTKEYLLRCIQTSGMLASYGFSSHSETGKSMGCVDYIFAQRVF